MANRIFDAMCEVKHAVEDALTARGIDLPDERYVAPGLEVSWDCCSLLAVSLVRIFNNTPDESLDPRFRGVCVTVLTAEIAVEVIRPCISVPKVGSGAVVFPGAAAMESDAMRLTDDADAMTVALAGLGKVNGCAVSLVGDVVPVGPRGMCGGNRGLIRVTL